jgi:CheY-like chemotaxis protein
VAELTAPVRADLELGFSGVLAKPFLRAQLREALLVVCQRQSSSLSSLQSRRQTFSK